MLRTQNFTPDEFFNESKQILEQVEKFENEIDNFSTYMPGYQMKPGNFDPKELTLEIQKDLD